jgi:hypothetical protein
VVGASRVDARGGDRDRRREAAAPGEQDGRDDRSRDQQRDGRTGIQPRDEEGDQQGTGRETRDRERDATPEEDPRTPLVGQHAKYRLDRRGDQQRRAQDHARREIAQRVQRREDRDQGGNRSDRRVDHEVARGEQADPRAVRARRGASVGACCHRFSDVMCVPR